MNHLFYKNILIYILCYNDDTEKKATELIKKYRLEPYSKLVRLPNPNIYLEFYMYTDYLPKHKEEWQDKDYVGTLSWKFFLKTSINMIRLQLFLRRFNPDIYTFVNYNYNFFETAEKYHPNFRKTWQLLFEKLGVPEDKIFPENIKGFFCNYWISNKQTMEQFLIFAKQIKNVLEDDKIDPELKELLLTDANYNGLQSVDELMINFGKPHYILQTFILERVICWFANHHKLKHIR